MKQERIKSKRGKPLKELKEPTLNEDHKRIVQTRLISELRRIQNETTAKFDHINTRRDLSTEIFGSAFKLDNYMKPGERWSDPPTSALYRINAWLSQNKMPLLDVNYIFYGDEHPYKRILDNIKLKTGIDVYKY